MNRKTLLRERKEELAKLKNQVIDSRGGKNGVLEPGVLVHYKSTLRFTKKPKAQIISPKAVAVVE